MRSVTDGGMNTQLGGRPVLLPPSAVPEVPKLVPGVLKPYDVGAEAEPIKMSSSTPSDDTVYSRSVPSHGGGGAEWCYRHF
jgi:hypothetical protein